MVELSKSPIIGAAIRFFTSELGTHAPHDRQQTGAMVMLTVISLGHTRSKAPGITAVHKSEMKFIFPFCFQSL